MTEQRKPLKRRSVNLRRKRQTTITGCSPTDKIVPQWDEKKREWRLVLDSENGIQIEHSDLTLDQPAA